MTAETASICRTCPWLEENQGRRHPDGWFTKTNRRRLWALLRRGEAMSCHRTDPGNPVSDAAVKAGFKRVPEGTEARDCIGATILVQREFTVFQDDNNGNLRDYRKTRPAGLLRDGIIAVVTRVAFGGVPLIGGRPMPLPNLNDTRVSTGLPGLDWQVRQPGDKPGTRSR